MYKRILRKRILKGLTIAVALFAVIPVSNAAAKPVSLVNKVSYASQAQQADPWFQTLMANQRYQNQNRPYAVSTEISTGLQGPSQPQTTVASTGSDFEWGNAGIGAGIAAVLIAGTAAALVVRSRQHGGFAH
jgi:hypothetical protein